MVDDFTSFSLPLIRNTGTRRPWWRRVLDWILRRKPAKRLTADDLFEDAECSWISDQIVRIEDEKDDIVDYSESS